MTFRRFILTVLAALALPIAASAVIPEKPYPERLVNDIAGVLSGYQVDSLEAVLVEFDRTTSNQITVVTVPTLDDYSVAEYALRLGNKWGVGSNRNNGVIVLLKPRGDDGYVDVTIQVGRGLEGAIPDAYASRIIRNLMGPYLRQDDYMPAISKACAELQALASGEISEPRDDGDEEDPFAIIFAVLVIIFFLVIILSIFGDHHGNGGGHYYGGGSDPMVIIGRGNGFPGSGFGGGFSGGSFGGGFGGFGGGSFGGGGASGRF